MSGPLHNASGRPSTVLRRGLALALGVLWIAASVGLRIVDSPAPWAASALQAVHVIEHVGIHAGLALWFGSTLRNGRMPLIARLALRVHGRLSPAKERYTRRLTQVWTGAFVGIALLSLALWSALPYGSWALFADVASPLLLVLLFFGEYALRYRLHPEFERTRVRDMVHAWTHAAAGDARRAGSR